MSSNVYLSNIDVHSLHRRVLTLCLPLTRIKVKIRYGKEGGEGEGEEKKRE
jgi:hypothetical protein